jgi:hypothetical protein
MRLMVDPQVPDLPIGTPRSFASGMLCRVAVLVRWWPVVAFIGIAIAVQNIVLAGYDARGHAADHLGSAQVVFFGGALVAIILWSTPRALRQLDVVVACGAWLVSLVGVAVGNLRVVDAIAGADWTDEQAATLGKGLRGFESGHDLAELCSFFAVGAAIVLTVVLFMRGHISRGVMIGAVVVSVLFPPWIVPGAGVLVLTIALCIARGRRLGTTPDPQPRNA